MKTKKKMFLAEMYRELRNERYSAQQLEILITYLRRNKKERLRLAEQLLFDLYLVAVEDSKVYNNHGEY